MRCESVDLFEQVSRYTLGGFALVLRFLEVNTGLLSDDGAAVLKLVRRTSVSGHMKPSRHDAAS